MGALEILQSFREDISRDRLASLRGDVGGHYGRVLEAQRRSELIAIVLAEALCTRLEALLLMAHLMDAQARSHIVGAARYFVSTTDERPDDGGCTGLDDDVAVFNHVALLIERAHFIIKDE